MMERESVVLRFGKVVHGHHRFPDTLDHPEVIFEDRVVGVPVIFDILDIGTSIIADIVVDVIVVERVDRNADESVRQGISFEITVDFVGIADLEGRLAHTTFLDSVLHLSGELISLTRRVQSH